MPFDFRRLRGRIIEKFGNCYVFAAHLGKSAGWLSNRLSNVVPWSSDEIAKACAPDALDIAPEDIPAYFFTPEFR